MDDKTDQTDLIYCLKYNKVVEIERQLLYDTYEALNMAKYTIYI